jgi:hypothetical protein
MKRTMKRAAPTQKGEPKFIYTSSCCGAQATKTPCVHVDKKAAETQGLGTFRCPTCRKPCKCGRTKNDRLEGVQKNMKFPLDTAVEQV